MRSSFAVEMDRSREPIVCERNGLSTWLRCSSRVRSSAYIKSSSLLILSFIGDITQAQFDDNQHLNIVGLVGSIDNDMAGTDMTIGENNSILFQRDSLTPYDRRGDDCTTSNLRGGRFDLFDRFVAFSSFRYRSDGTELRLARSDGGDQYGSRLHVYPRTTSVRCQLARLDVQRLGRS